MRLAAIIALATLPGAVLAQTDTLRIATWNVELSRDGPGLLLRDIASGKDEQVAATLKIIAGVAPDIIAIQSFDHDYGLKALGAFRAALETAGVRYDHLLSLPSNRGMATGLDMNGDGRLGGPEDSQGFGAFTGQAAMALLSRFPLERGEVQDFSALRWRNLPDALLPHYPSGAAFPSDGALARQRLSSAGHWVVPIRLPTGAVLRVGMFHATPPVFDGMEDRNGRRNHDEVMFWKHYLDGAFGPVSGSRFVLLGDANLDPFDGDGRSQAILALLNDPRFHDPLPRSAGAAAAPDEGQSGAGALDTVEWQGVGRLRVDYVLPTGDLSIVDSGVYWPAPGTPDAELVRTASRHHLVWVDLVMPSR